MKKKLTNAANEIGEILSKYNLNTMEIVFLMEYIKKESLDESEFRIDRLLYGDYVG